MNQLRLNKYIALCGVASRRKADELIKSGKVKINGEIITEPGTSVSPKDKVLVNNKQIALKEKKYAIFYKPAGYITSLSDPTGRKTIYDILPEEFRSLKPAGRLDKDSTGLLLLTNDGELIQNLTHPKCHVPKVYRVSVQGKINQNHLFKLQQGIEIEKGKIAYAHAIPLEYERGQTTLQITLHQGYNRQIRRMMDILEMPVVSLKRITHGCIQITGLKRGEHRFLSRKEIDNLFKYLKNIEKKAKKITLNLSKD